MKKIFAKVRSILEEGVIKCFGNESITYEMKSIMNVNIVVKKWKNPIERLLKKQLKIGLKCLSKLLNLLISLLLDLFSAITNSINPTDFFYSFFQNAKNNSLKILKDDLKNCMNNLKYGCLSELKKLISRKFQNEEDLISSWTDYFIKGAKVYKDITEAEKLTSILVENGVLSLDGELNNEEIIDKKEKFGNS